MVNLLYSLLVAGSDPIPEDWYAYRKYTGVYFSHPNIPTHTDPFMRSHWANYIINMAKLSNLFPRIIEKDPSNTYKIPCIVPMPVCNTTNCFVVKHSTSYPKLAIEGTVMADGISAVVNGITEILPKESNILDIKGCSIDISGCDDVFTLDIINPSSGVYIPSPSDIRKLFVDLDKDVIGNINMDSPQDRACALALSIINRYN